MIRRSLFAAMAVILACGLSAGSALAGQAPLADAQHDYNAGRYNRAVDALNSAIAKSPDDASLHFLLGQSYYQLGDFPRAVASFERAVQLVSQRFRISRLARQVLRPEGRGEHVSERDELGAKNAPGI